MRILLIILMLVGCNADLTVQTSSVGTVSQMGAGIGLRLIAGNEISNDSAYSMGWETGDDVDAAAGFSFHVSNSVNCENPIFNFDGIQEKSKKLDFLKDGVYYFCLFGKSKSGKLIAADNNGIKIILDRAVPLISVNEEFLAKQAFKIEPTINDFLATTVVWEKVSGPGEVNFSNPTTPNILVSMTAEGVYQLRLVVLDLAGNQSEKIIRVVWDASAPAATAGADLIANHAIALSPTADAATVAFHWEKVSGPGLITFDNADSKNPVVSASAEGTYVLRLSAADAAGNTTVDEMNFTWDTTPPAIAPIGNLLTGTPLLIDATVTSTAMDQPLIYSWSKVSGPGIISPALPYPAEDITALADTNGIYILRLAVTDAAGNTATRDVQFEWDNSVPTVNVGADKFANAMVGIDATTTLAASYSWTKVSGPGILTFGSPAAEDTTVSANADGVYVVRLSATNSSMSQTVSDALTLTWDTGAPYFQAPLVDAASKNPINVTADVRDAMTTLTYAWTKVSGPGNVTFSQPSATATTITVDQDGSYVIRLTATDQAGNSIFDELTYTRDATPPVFTSLNAINAANDGYVNASETNISLPLFSLNAASYDAVHYSAILNEATPQTCDGTQSYPNTTIPHIDQLLADGTFVLCVKLEDAVGNITYGKSQVVVRDTVLPTVDAGANVVSNTTLNLNATTSGATTWTWSKIGGSGNVTFGTPNAEDTSAVADTDDVYTLRLSVADAAGNSAFSDLFYTRDTAVPTFTSLNGANQASDGWINSSEVAAVGAAFTLVASGHTNAAYSNFLDDSTPVVCDGSKVYGNSSIPLINTIPATDKPYAVCVRLSDSANNITYGKSQTITRDTVMPTVNGGADITANATAAIDATTGGAVTYQWSKVSGPGTITFGSASAEDTTVSASIDGTYVLRITVSDAAGNSAQDDVGFIWDTTAPVFVSLLGSHGASDNYINAAEAASTQALLLLDASDFTTLRFTAPLDDSTPITCDASKTYVGSSIPRINEVPATDGPYAVCVELKDGVGNTTYGKSAVIVKDTVAPTVNVGLDIITNVAVLRDAASSGGLTYAWTKVSGSGTITFGSASAEDTTISAASNGIYVVRLTVTDVAGNSTSDDLNFEWDTQAPVFTSLNAANEASNGYVNSAEVSSALAMWTLVSSGASTINYTVILDDTAPNTCDVSKTYSQSSIPAINALPASDKPYAICVALSDAAGNVTYGKSQVVVRDTVAPTVNVGSDVTTNTTVSIDATTSGATTYLWTKQSGPGSVTFGSATTEDSSVTAGSDGVYVIRLTATDAAGNSSFDELTFTRNTSGPGITSFNGANEASNGYVNAAEASSALAMLTLSASNYVLAEFTAALDDTSTVTCNGTQSYALGAIPVINTLGSDKPWVVCVKLTDGASNVAYGKSQVIVRDTVVPTVNVGLDQLRSATFGLDASTSGGAAYAWSKQSGSGTITFGTPSTEDTSVSASADGVYVLRLTVTDAAGNSNFDELNFTWDTAAPVLTSLNGNAEAANAWINAAEVSATNPMFALVASGYDTVNYTTIFNDTVPQTCDGSKTYSLSSIPLINAIPTSDAPYAICVKLADTAGNITYGKSQVITRDIGIPTVNAGADFNSNTSISINATTGGATSWTWSKQSGPGTITFGTGSAEDTTASASTDGTYVLRLTVADAAGNSAYDELNYIKDTAAPTFTSLNGANGASDGYINASETSSALALLTLVASGQDAVAYTAVLDDTPSVTCNVSQTYGSSSIPLINTIPATDDSYAVCVRLSDNAGNITYGKSQVIVRDATVPVFTSLNTINGASDGYINSSESSSALAGFTLVASGHTSDDFTAYLDDTPSITCDSGKTYSNANVPLINTIPATDETYAVCVKLMDAAGNITYGKSQSIVLDTAAPTVNAGADFNSNASISINATTGSATSWTWSKQSGPGTITFGTGSAEDTTASASTDGTYVLRLTVTDAAGNSAYDELNYVKDTVVPTFTSLNGANGASDGYVNSSETSSALALLTLVASGQDVVAYTAVLDDTPSVTCNVSQTYGSSSIPLINTIPAADDSYAVCVRLSDNAGNITYGKSQVIIRDTTAPVFTSLNGANGASDGYINNSETSSSAVGFTLVASGHTSDDFTAYLDDTPSITCDSGKTYGNTDIPLINTMTATDDTYAVCVKLTDVAGNIAYGKSQSIVRDTGVPTVNVGADILTNASYSINATSSGATTWTWSKVSGPGTVTFGTPNAEDTTASANTDGAYVLRLTVADAAGNSALDDLNFTWDATAPAFSSLALANDATDTYIGPADITANQAIVGAVSGSGYDTVIYQVFTSATTCSGATYTASANTIPLAGSLSATANGTYKVCVKLTDTVGNTPAYGASPTFTLDKTAPTAGASGALVTQDSTNGTVTLSWTKGTDAVSAQANLQYQVFYGTSSTFGTLAQVEAGTAANVYTTDIATLVVTGLSPLTTYYFNVVVKDQAGNKAVYTKTSDMTREASFTQIGAGALYSCALTGEGKAYCWGSDTVGQLGNGAAGASTVPSLVNTSLVFQKLSVGAQHACAIADDGKAYCWGDGSHGKLGNAATSNQTSPVAVNTTDRFKDISAGDSHTCAIRVDGVAFCWGYDSSDQLGNGATSTDQTSPVQVSSLTGVKAISAGNTHSCALLANGNAYCWGSDANGRLGDGGGAVNSNVPVLVAGGHKWKSIVANSDSTCGLRSDGLIYCWGNDTNGQIGNGATTTADQYSPIVTNTTQHWRALSLGGSVYFGIQDNGQLYAWGINTYGQLGTSDTSTKNTPTAVSGSNLFRTLGSGLDHSCAITTRGKTYCWGRNDNGQLGNGTTTASTSPGLVNTDGVTSSRSGLSSAGWLKVTGEYYVSCGLKTNGKAYCWGSYAYDAGGIGASTSTPKPVLGSDYFIDIINLSIHTCGITEAGDVKCWGTGFYGELGDGSMNSGHSSPYPVSSSEKYIALALGRYHTCAINSSGIPRCWGTDGAGKLGNGSGTTADQSTPTAVAVNTANTFIAISAGDYHTCGLTDAGSAYCWGYNGYGQVGDGTVTDAVSPTAVSGGQTYVSLSAGGLHSCGLRSNGALACWGGDDSGELGDDATIADKSVPVAVDSGNTYIGVGATTNNTCGVRSDFSLYCWGSQTYGTVGDGTTGTDRPTPVAVNTTLKFKPGVYGVNAMIAITTTGEAYTWGSDNNDILGNGTDTADVSSPTPVVNPITIVSGTAQASYNSVPISVVFDGLYDDPNPYWNEGDYSGWIQFNIDSTRSIKKVRMQMQHNPNGTATLYYSTGITSGSLTVQSTKTRGINNKEYISEYSTSPWQNTRFLRVLIDSTAAWVGMYEIEIYE